MKTYRVQFSPEPCTHLTRAWMNIEAKNPEHAAIGILKRNHVILSRYIGKTCVAHVASPDTPKHPNGMPMVTNGFVMKIGKESPNV